jgi:DNA uptake protein ComE-like DNA-binding protein
MFTKSQQSGILLLLLIIFILQGVYFLYDFSKDEPPIDEDELNVLRAEVDSLKQVELHNKKPKIFPFNPNYITDHKGYTLGLTIDQIDRLHAHRDQNKWVNSAKEFQQVTKVSDSLLNEISPYFKFPDWVTNPKPRTFQNNYSNKEKPFDQKIDLNKATAKQLQRINGIGEKISERIVKFRNTFVGGFISNIQLNDVYGLTPEVIERLTREFTVKTPRQINKINLNNASVEKLVTIQHIDYDLAYEIEEQRTLRNGFQSMEELKKVKGFPINKIEIIKLYLTLE